MLVKQIITTYKKVLNSILHMALGPDKVFINLKDFGLMDLGRDPGSQVVPRDPEGPDEKIINTGFFG